MGTVIGIIIGIGLILAAAALKGWAIMLLLGVLWHEFDILSPLGFWPCAGIGLLLSLILGSGARVER